MRSMNCTCIATRVAISDSIIISPTSTMLSDKYLWFARNVDIVSALGHARAHHLLTEEAELGAINRVAG